ncbi:hypothetical protein KDA_36650 [Dictyobacter alpinus]|uniref:Uncharacterized protein n=1 Tax=Dictyobacter alpinus TaxID=2014873 RepID=A0A402B9W6_9CHLR|nr:hypothetical protein KDA_36650 [Dictyobacter alpinus]
MCGARSAHCALLAPHKIGMAWLWKGETKKLCMAWLWKGETKKLCMVLATKCYCVYV